jgi:hypothetical protein
MESFRERVTSKLRDDLPDMLPDEVLATLVQESVTKLFSSAGSTGDRPWLESLVRDFAEPIIHRAVNDYLDENKNLIERGVKKALDEVGPIIIANQTDAFQMMAMAIDQIRMTMQSRPY